MRAVWYTGRGSADDVLQFGAQPKPVPGPGEVLLRIRYSGVNPGDVKKRSGWQDAPMPYPLVIPHSDGSGWIEAVGEHVDPSRVGRAAWCFGAQSYRPKGTAAEYAAVPADRVIDLPGEPTDDIMKNAACLGIPGITAHYGLLADGPINNKAVLIYGAAGRVGLLACEIAKHHRGHVIPVVRRPEQHRALTTRGYTHTVLDDGNDFIPQIKELAPTGIDRILDVDFTAHIEQNTKILGTNATIAAYYSSNSNPPIPYWQLGFANTTIRFLGSDDFPLQSKQDAAHDLTALLSEGLTLPIEGVCPLSETATAHKAVEAGKQLGYTLIGVD
ncbi:MULTISPECIES: NADPH:quinone reductase [unclassified Mycobacteroides]|uniref:NADPH:quinone reductase n=1 Tax=unclassified Mycobacteroides TaxID=2618759 RepID=UPI001326D293|nr:MULTISPECIES: NADPH:quinone reductase [unclassified Mycobacteroides]MUM18878.1 hypothetical protein [Mycobacteroides sp. CBMA 326]